MFSKVKIELFIRCLRNGADGSLLFFVFVFFTTWQYFLYLFLSTMHLILPKQIQWHRQQKTNEKSALTTASVVTCKTKYSNFKGSGIFFGCCCYFLLFIFRFQ